MTCTLASHEETSRVGDDPYRHHAAVRDEENVGALRDSATIVKRDHRANSVNGQGRVLRGPSDQSPIEADRSRSKPDIARRAIRASSQIR
jgi:hypothetical protein